MLFSLPRSAVDLRCKHSNLLRTATSRPRHLSHCAVTHQQRPAPVFLARDVIASATSATKHTQAGGSGSDASRAAAEKWERDAVKRTLCYVDLMRAAISEIIGSEADGMTKRQLSEFLHSCHDLPRLKLLARKFAPRAQMERSKRQIERVFSCRLPRAGSPIWLTLIVQNPTLLGKRLSHQTTQLLLHWGIEVVAAKDTTREHWSRAQVYFITRKEGQIRKKYQPKLRSPGCAVKVLSESNRQAQYTLPFFYDLLAALSS